MAKVISQIICIGDELLIGQVINTNASWLAEQLTLNGINVEKIITIADNRNDILLTLNDACCHADLVIITGGLGPTKDDITKLTLCEYLNTKLVFSDVAFENIQEIFNKRKSEISETNRKQAEVPEGSIVLQNKNGTAPGLWMKKENTIFVALPGVPFEMKELFTNSVLPKIKQQFSTPQIIHKTIHTIGIAESHLSDILTNWEKDLKENNLSLAYLPQPGIVRLRITGSSGNITELNVLINKKIDLLKMIIPTYIFGFENDSIESAIGKILIQSGKTVSTAESCTGGRIAGMLSSIPGSSEYFLGSVVAYSNDVKINLLGVKPEDIKKFGAVSQQVVEEMAIGVQKLTNSDFAVATSGIAGPDGGSKEKPVGTVWIAIASVDKIISKQYVFGTLRDINVARSSVMALNLLRKKALNLTID